MGQPDIEVLVVDDHPIVRRGLVQLVDQQAGLRVTGEAEGAGQAQALVEETNPNVVLLDLSLEGMSGLELLKQLRSFHPDLSVLVISMHDEKLYAERALEAGAKGYIMKRAPDDEVIRAVRSVAADETYISDELRLEWSRRSQRAQLLDQLSDRELEIFFMLGQGFAPRHIAEELCISPKTVESHRQRMKDKLQLNDAVELTRFAVSWYKEYGPT